jgi:hypothetical protein
LHEKKGDVGIESILEKIRMSTNKSLYILFLIVIGFCVGCDDARDLISVKSPDGRAIARVVVKEQTEPRIIGPKPSAIKAKKVRLIISFDGKKTYDSGLKDVSIEQSLPFAVDLAWSPDSNSIAYRLVTTFQITNKEGKSRSIDVIHDNSLISSFKWTSNKELLIVTKKIDEEPLDTYGLPLYDGYIVNAENIRIVKLNVDSGLTERFSQDIKTRPFIFHSIRFLNQEISPYSNRVVFSHGNMICVYDDSAGKIIKAVPIEGSVEGTWWDTNDKIIVGIGLLSNPERHFMIFDVLSGSIENKTSQFLEKWKGQLGSDPWSNPDWFREK